MKMAPEWFENWIDKYEGTQRKVICLILFNIIPCAWTAFVIYRLAPVLFK